MNDLVVFFTKRSGRIEAQLGRWVVGVIEPWSPEMVGVKGNGCHYQVKIFELQPAQEARSIQWARRQLLFRIADMLDGAGPSFQEQANLIREQAEVEQVLA